MSHELTFSPAASYLLDKLTTLRYFHWNEESLNRHEEIGKFYDYLDSWTDEIVEAWIGCFGRQVSPPSYSENVVFTNVEELLISLREWVVLDFPALVVNDRAFTNKADDLAFVIDKTLYLLRLN